MEVGELYQFVLLLVLIGLIVGVGVLILDKFKGATNSADTTLNTTLDAGISAIGSIASDWLALIVTIAVLAIILTLVIRSFGGARR